MARDTGIADRLRAAGLRVVEVADWKTRGSSDFGPQGSVDHHTAGAKTGNAPSLNVCINGRPDLPGPLCHVLIGRDNTCFVVAAGRANHAGSGGWRGLSGNSTVYGVERENVGTTAEPWRPDQTDTAAKVHAALIRGRTGPEMVCLHKEWAPGRKVDPHTITGPDLRARVASYLTKFGAPAPKPPPEDDMITVISSEPRENGTPRYWAALMDGYVRIFNAWDPGPWSEANPGGYDQQTVWCPNSEYDEGVGVVYKQVQSVSPWKYDNCVQTAKRRPA